MQNCYGSKKDKSTVVIFVSDKEQSTGEALEMRRDESNTQTLWRTISENRRNVPVSPAFDRQLVQCHIPPFLCHSLLYMLHFTDAWLHKYSLRRCKSRMLPRNY